VFTISDAAPIDPRYRGACLAVGNFDGVHRGHAALIARLRARADALGVAAVALTFDPHPAALLRPEAAPVPLTWPERTETLLLDAGASAVGAFRTGPWLLDRSARDFFERIILGQLAARGMVEGPNFAFGHDRGGDVATLERWCRESGIAFEVATPLSVGASIVSSSRIRRLIAEGAVRPAAELLGRPHRLRGTVVRGAGRGAGLGFPTANLAGIDVLIPADGVYAMRAYVENDPAPIPAAVHIGPNATFGEQARSVEAHLIDFSGDLYGRTLELDVIDRLRGTMRFDSVANLLAQIHDDVDAARALGRSLSGPDSP
jgi:riboflavin kinase/FMN adenylyltransferase